MPFTVSVVTGAAPDLAFCYHPAPMTTSGSSLSATVSYGRTVASKGNSTVLLLMILTVGDLSSDGDDGENDDEKNDDDGDDEGGGGESHN